MTNDERDIQRKLRVLQHADSNTPRRSAMPAKPVDILGSAGPVSIDGGMPIKSMVKLA